MAHEDLQRDQEVEGSSDRAFGVVFAVVFVLIGAWPLLYGSAVRWWALGIALAFALTAAIRPALLAAMNRAWLRLGLFLGKVISPIALGVLFFVVLVPIGIAMRMAGKDPLRLKRDAGTQSYWIPRMPPGPPPDSMKNQF
jgi:hypothetical protein